MSVENFRTSSSFAEILDRARFSPEDEYIAVMGVTGAGKSTFISKCCNEAALSIGHSLKSETQEIRLYTFYLNAKKIHLIDTPGFDDTYKSDSQLLRDLAYWLSKSYGAGFKLSGIIYLHPITATRMSGTAFKNLRTFRKLCGKQSMSSVVLVTTMWSDVRPEEGRNRESDLSATEDFWGNMIKEGSTTFRHSDDHGSAMKIVSHILNKGSKTVLSIQTEMVDLSRPLDHTEAGREVDGEMSKQRDVYQRELEITKEEMQEAIENNDSLHAEEILKEQEMFQRKIADIERGREALRIGMEKLIREKEEQHRRDLADLTRKLSEQEAETVENIETLNRHTDSWKIRNEQEARMRIALEAELDAAQSQADRGDAEKQKAVAAVIEAMRLRDEEQLPSASKIQQGTKSMGGQVSAAEKKRQQSLEKEARKRQGHTSNHQQLFSYAEQIVHLQEQAGSWDPQAIQEKATSLYDNVSVGLGLAGDAFNTMTALSGCTVM